MLNIQETASLTCAILLTTLSAYSAESSTSPSATDIVTITSDAHEVITPSHLWLGMGFNWSAYEGFCNPDWYFGDEAVELTDREWATITERLKFMRMKFVRFMTYSSGYLRGKDEHGEPLYVFREKEPNLYLRNIYRALDWMQTNDVLICMGDWQMGYLNSGFPKGHPYPTRIQADFLEHLYKEKGYTNIRYWCSGNEEHIMENPDQLREWIRLKDEFAERGIPVGLVGPDHYHPNYRVEALWMLLTEYPDLCVAYENHYYRGYHGIIERKMIDRLAPNGKNTPWFAGEANQPRSWDHTPGEAVGVVAAYIEHLNIRSSGVLHWMLDSSQYREHRLHGIWQIKSGEVYPRFYTLSLFNRLFWAPGADGKGGGAIIQTVLSSRKRVNACAIIRPAGGNRYDFSWALVNTTQKHAIEIELREKQAASTCDLALYRYDAHHPPADPAAFPEPVRILKNADPAKGISLTLPPYSAVFLTTDDGGSPLTLESHP